MRAVVRVLLLVLAASVCISHAQNNNNNSSNANNNNKQPQQQQQNNQQNNQQQQPQQQQQQQQQQRSIWDEPIRFSTKSKDTCTMVVSGAGDYTRLRVSCKGPSQGQAPGRSYYCDFQGKPNLCRAYNLNPRHYFTQMMWDMRKLSHACQGPKVYRPAMCKKYPEEAQMTFLASWPKPATTPGAKAASASTTPAKAASASTAKTTAAATTKPAKAGQDQQQQQQRRPAVPAQPKPAVITPKPFKPQPQPHPVKPQAGKGSQARKPTPKPGKTTPRPTEHADAKSARLANEYCWKSFHGICTYFISWFQN